jgi:S-adenosylmethionine synthetase
MNKYLFTSESVSEGHPDKISDQISDALLDEFLKNDPDSKVACETLVTTGLVVCAGEVRTNGYIDIQKVVRETIKNIGYTKAEYRFDSESCGVISTIHEQSNDIYQGVKRENPESQGAGDQGIMFGYASNETDNYMPLSIYLSHMLLKELADIRKEGLLMTYLRPDSKSQVTVEYENNKPTKINTIVVSTQHDDNVNNDVIYEDIMNILIPRVAGKLPSKISNMFNDEFKLFVNPTGKFVIGGPHGDTGLTGRKIIVDTYGGKGAHGGGAFCFSYDTLIKTKDGHKKISEINVKDNVYTINEDTRNIELKKVLNIFEKSKEDSYELLELELENGEKIKITENHEVMLKNGEWIKAKYLKENDDIFNYIKKSIKVKNIKKIEKEKTYDLSIDDNHNYFVGNSDILVHNSGKDSSKVDRSAAYAARHIAKNIVASGIADEVLIQIAYAIGIAEPVGFFVNTFGTGKFSDNIISNRIKDMFDLRPYFIINRFGLKNPIYLTTASYGHFGRDSYNKEIEVFYEDSETYKRIEDGKEKIFKNIEFFPWEKLDYVEKIRDEFKYYH